MQYGWAREFPDYKKCSANNLSIDLLISNSRGPCLERNRPRMPTDDQEPETRQKKSRIRSLLVLLTANKSQVPFRVAKFFLVT